MSIDPVSTEAPTIAPVPPPRAAAESPPAAKQMDVAVISKEAIDALHADTQLKEAQRVAAHHLQTLV